MKKGKEIKNLRRIRTLALERKSIIWDRQGKGLQKLPAAFILSWQLNLILNCKLYEVGK